MYLIALLPALFSVVVTGLLVAQETPPVQPGDRIRLSSAQYSGIATFVELASDTLVVLRPGDGARLPVPVGSIRSFAVSRGSRSRDTVVREAAFTGGAIGGVTGLVVGLLGGDDPPHCTQELVCFVGCATVEVCRHPGRTAGQKGWERTWQLGLTGAALGALTGAVVRPGERWERTLLLYGATVAPSRDGGVSAGFSFSF
jgi:hypothetical protein